MNLEKLFKIQAELDKRIVEKHGLQNEDLLGKKILALQVELGELANEWRGFKFWSEDQEPNICDLPKGTCTCRDCEMYYCDKVHESTVEAKNLYVNPLLEEYVDCLHFILSIGNELKKQHIKVVSLKYEFKDITEAFRHAFNWVVNLDYAINEGYPLFRHERAYKRLFDVFYELGRLLGFTWEQIEEAYLTKNKINHERQESGY